MTTKAAAMGSSAGHQLPGWLGGVRHWRLVLDISGLVIVGAAVLSVAVQFLYPADRALPFTQIGGLDIGFKDKVAVEAQLTEYAQQGEVTVATPSSQWRAKWQAVGVSVDGEASASAALTYETWERAIPFSSVARVVESRSMPLVAISDSDRLDAFAEQIVKEDKQAAKDATIKVDKGEVVVDTAKNGYQYTAEDIKRQIQATPVSLNGRLQLQPEEVPFVRSSQALAQAQQEAEAALNHTLTVKVADKTYAPGRGVIGDWLHFADEEKNKTVKLVVNRDAVKKYLEEINKDIGVDPGTITVTLLDDQEVGRTKAPPGRSVATDASIDRLGAALTSKDQTPVITLAVADVPPQITYVRNYSQSSAGLQAVINDWDRDNSGDFAVLVRELEGERRYADIQPDKHFVTASTFKLFTYYSVQQRIQSGAVGYHTMTDMGWTVEACLEEMIVRSTNPCAIALTNMVGWPESQDMVAAAGFKDTHINNKNGGEKRSTVRDETNYIMRLNAGTLMGEEATSRLLGYLKRQIWRAGIPSGVPRGVTVADKVGFYNGWRHDIAVVYAPKGAYILGVMSRGGSDWQFANLSRRVYAFFNN